jgi:hypothetical protein
MRLALAISTSLVATLAACSPQDLAINSTSKVLLAGQPSLQQESDYEMARTAIPGALKTVEAFWISGYGNSGAHERLERILTEGYCQYGTAFVEDDWEEAKFRKDIPAIEYHNARATHIFTRCMNYALKSLGSGFQKDIFGTTDQAMKRIASTGGGNRFALMFAGTSLGSLINHNLTRVEMISYLAVVEAIMLRVIEIDKKNGAPSNKTHAALPYLALGMLYSGKPKSMGGEPEKAKAMFEQALAITDGKFLLARALMGYRVGLQTNDEKFFHEQLSKVLETDPAIWPEQRLANEVAHRRARRYLSHEKELFQ